VKRTHFVYVSDVARRRGCSKDTVRRDIDAGVLPAVRMPNGTRLIDERDADRYAERSLQRRTPTGDAVA
jgi:excisionase family DNA binding protein